MTAAAVDLTPPDAARFWAKVNQAEPSACWLWTASVGQNGYGYFKLNGRPVLAHLEPVSQGENTRRGVGPYRAGLANTRRAEQRTHCRHGHPFTAENTYTTSKNARQCLTCKRAAKQRFDAALRT